MPHGSVRLGDVEVVGVCDAVVRSSSAVTDAFPGADTDVWAEARDRYPRTFDADRWRLHVHCFVVRTRGRMFLVDTGVGPSSAPAFAWTRTPGRLLEELSAAGVDPAEIELVVITHVHDDHVGWNVAADGAPAFPNARYLIHAADWDVMADAQDEEDRLIFSAVLSPLMDAGIVERTNGRVSLTDELTVEHAPGHTPGHQVLTIDAEGRRALIAGDLVNHPVQLLRPGLAGTSDMDAHRASVTRAQWVDRIVREERLVCSAHFPEAFGWFVAEGDSHAWLPLELEGG